jgi:hypothetical protein
MGVKDAYGRFNTTVGTAQSFTSPAYSQEQVDFGVANPNIGFGGKAAVNVVVTSTVTATTATYMNVYVCGSAATTPTTTNLAIARRSILLSDMIAGTEWSIPLPPTVPRYIRLYYDSNDQTAFGVAAVESYLHITGTGGK